MFSAALGASSIPVGMTHRHFHFNTLYTLLLSEPQMIRASIAKTHKHIYTLTLLLSDPQMIRASTAKTHKTYIYSYTAAE